MCVALGGMRSHVRKARESLLTSFQRDRHFTKSHHVAVAVVELTGCDLSCSLKLRPVQLHSAEAGLSLQAQALVETKYGLNTTFVMFGAFSVFFMQVSSTHVHASMPDHTCRPGRMSTSAILYCVSVSTHVCNKIPDMQAVHAASEHFHLVLTLMTP